MILNNTTYPEAEDYFYGNVLDSQYGEGNSIQDPTTKKQQYYSQMDSLSSEITAKAGSSGKKTIQQLVQTAQNLLDRATFQKTVERTLTSLSETDLQGITAIGHSAFRACALLTSASIPFGVTSIGAYAFSDCILLASVDIPSSVVYFGTYAFATCRALTSISIPSGVTSIPNYMLSECNSLANISLSNITGIGNYSFKNCTSLTSISIPSSVTSIGNGAFSGCSLLATINIPSGVTSINDELLYGCSSLTSVALSANITSIGARAFRNCSSLSYISILASNPPSLDNVNAFDNTNNCPIYVPSSSLTAYQNATNWSALANRLVGYSEGLSFISNGDGTCSVDGIGTCTDTNIIIPPVSPVGDLIESISADAFWDCSMLTSIVIPSGVTSIGDRAFANCSSLTGIEIPSSMTSIGDDAFSYCTSLTSVTFGENSQLTSIGDNAFCYCNALTSIVIPSSVTSIGNGAFWGCSSLESMTLPFVGNRSGVTASDFNQYPLGYIFGEYEYAGGTIVTQNYYLDSLQTTTATNYCIPSSLTTIKILGGAILRGGLQNCTMLQTISLEDEVTMVAVNAVRNCTNLTSVYIGEKVSAIGYGGGYAFAGCTALSSVTFSENSVLTNFTGGHNFANCPIVSIEIPAGITNLSANNFEQCKKLTTVIFRSSNNLTIIGVAAFTGCELLSTINIPLSLTTISNYAFSNCSALPSIILPSSLTTIGNSAFLNCSNLITINFMGTESQWNAISKGTSWDSGMPANYTVVYNYSPS